MVFSSITFLYFFLPFSLILYFITPGKLKNTVLLFLSLLFYAWGEPKFVAVMIITIILGYIFGLIIDKSNSRKKSTLALISFIVFCLGILGYFKYFNFFVQNLSSIFDMPLGFSDIILPLGISFYTFQVISYVADVYRGTVRAQKSFVNMAVYIAMFPQLIAGPIVRYKDIENQLTDRSVTLSRSAEGARRFIIGLAKKVIIANSLGELCNIFKASDDVSLLYYWMYAVAFSLQIYYDFSGYSDMAIGIGKILGFTFCENFNYPYISGSITEFWRRWHISLGTWFRDYVYIPLGGNRKGLLRQLINITVVWLLTGLWHGANWTFVIWGLYFAVFLTIEKLFLKKILCKMHIIPHIYVSVIVVISFVIFNADNLSEAFLYISAMFGAGEIPLSSAEFIYYIKSYALILIIGIIGATPLPKIAVQKLYSKKPKAFVLESAETITLLLLLAICTAFIVDGSFNPFLYFRF